MAKVISQHRLVLYVSAGGYFVKIIDLGDGSVVRGNDPMRRWLISAPLTLPKLSDV